MHSNYSADGKQDLKQILKTTKQKGFDIIAITDHDSIDVYDELYNMVKNRLTKPLIIPGVELTMDNKEYGSINHNISISERKNIVISGVKKLNSFDNKEFFVESIMGHILIKGENLELIKLDTFQGNLSIKGKISSVIYLDDNRKAKTDSIMARLFK